MKKRLLFFSIFYASALKLVFSMAFAQLPGTNPSSEIPLFNSNKVFGLELRGDFPALISKQVQEIEGFIQYNDDQGNKKIINVNFEIRGNSRKDLCKDLPPLKLTSSDGKWNDDPIFLGLADKIKLVTNCHISNDEESNEAVMQEIAIYQMLEAAGLLSFKIRQLQIIYKNKEGTEAYAGGPGFFIEPLKDLKKRWNYFKNYLPLSDQNDNYTELRLAEILATNRDYSIDPISNCHNVHCIITDPVKMTKIFVPYDFDLTELISNPNYTPDAANEIWLSDFDKKSFFFKNILKKRSSLNKAIETSTMNEKSKKKFLARIKAFYKVINKI